MARGGYDVSITITTQWREGGKPPSPQHIEKIKKPIRDLNTEIRKQQGLLSRFYNNWKSTFAVFAAGYVSVVLFLETMRALSNTITGGIKKIAEFEASVASLTARLISLIRTRPGESLSAGWERISNYVKDVYTWAVKLDAQFIGTAEELMEAFKALTDQGIILNVQTEEHRKAWLAIAAAAKAANPHIQRQGQIYQEIRGFLQGITRQGNELARQAKALIPNYQEQVKLLSSVDEWVQFINTHFMGYLVLSQKIGRTWDAIVATFGSYFSLLQRFGLRPLFETLKNIILDMANYLREHLVPLSENFALIWREISPAIRLVADIFGIIFKTISAMSPVIAAISYVIGTLAALFRAPLKLFSLILDKIIDYEGELIEVEKQQKRTFSITEDERKLLELRKKEEKIDLAKPLKLAEEAEFELLAAAKSATYARLELKRREIKEGIEAIKNKIKAHLEERQLELKLAQEGKKEAEREKQRRKAEYQEFVKLRSEYSRLQQQLLRATFGGPRWVEVRSQISQVEQKLRKLSESADQYDKAQEEYTKHSEKAKQAEQDMIKLRGKLAILNKYLALVTKQLREEDERLRKEKEEGTKEEISNIQKIRDAYDVLLMDYKKYASQNKEISQEIATERLRIEAKLTGSLETEYKYRMKQVEEWETQQLNRVLSIRNAMLKKIEAMARRIREEAAKEGRTSPDQLTQEELKMLVNLIKKRVQVEKDAEDAITAIRKAGAEKQKEIFLDLYEYAINFGQILEDSVANAFKGIMLGTRKLSDVFKAMRDSVVGDFAQMFARMIRNKLDFDTIWFTNTKDMEKQFSQSTINIRKIWSSAINWLKGSTGKLLGTLGTAAYSVAGMVRGEPWRAVGGAGATVAMLTGHPAIAVATIATAEIARAVFKGRVEWVGVGAGAAGIPVTQIGLRAGMPFGRTLGGATLVGAGLGAAAGIALGGGGGALGAAIGGGTLGAILGGAAFGAGAGLAIGALVGIFSSIFNRKWPTIRGTAELSLKGVSDSLDYVEWYMEHIKETLGEHTEIYATYKTEFARISLVEKRDVKGSMDELAKAFGGFISDLVDFYKNVLPETMKFEELPDIKFTFGAGKKNMENLAKQFVNETISQTYNSWAVPIIQEYNRLLGVDLFEKFGLPELGELPVDLGHKWNEEMEQLYERISKEVVPSLDVAFKYAKSMMALMDAYGEGIVDIYKDDIAGRLTDMLDKYKAEVAGLDEEEVKKKAEELGKTVDEYLSTALSFIEDIENTIAKYTLAPGAKAIWDLGIKYQENIAKAKALGVSIERVNLAIALEFFAPIEDILDTRSDYEKALDDLDAWYDAAIEFFNANRDVLEGLGYNIDMITQAYKKQKEQIIESQLHPLEDLITGINSELESLGVTKPAFTIEDFRRKWSPYMEMIPSLLKSLGTTMGIDLLGQYAKFYTENMPEIISDTEKYIELLKKQHEEQKEVYEEQLRYIEEQIDYTKQLIDTWGDVADAVQDKINEIRLVSLTPEQTWGEVQKQWRDLVNAFWAQPSAETAQALLNYSDTYLSAAQDMYKSSERFLKIKEDVLHILEQVHGYAVSEQEILRQKLDDLYQQEQRVHQVLQQIDTDLTTKLGEVITWLQNIEETIKSSGGIGISSMGITSGGGGGVSKEIVGGVKEAMEKAAKAVEETPKEAERTIAKAVKPVAKTILESLERYGMFIPPEHAEKLRKFHPMQEGGIITSPTYAMLGEGGPEAVIPLTRSYSFHVEIDYDKLASVLAKKIESRPIMVEIDAPIKLDGKEIKKWIWKSKMAREVF